MNLTLVTPTKQSLLSEWLYYIAHLHPVSIDLNLDRIRKIAITLNLIHPGSYVVLIGGTNGKGTTCCLLESILLYNNISVGLYTSPHLLSYNERVRICGKELSDNVHIEAMSVIEQTRHNIALTYFEFITLSALYIFKQNQLDVIILEVGLGGRLDATNIVEPDISVITNIAIDHVDFLGNSKDMIAREKSGIIRPNRPIIIGDVDRPIIIDKIVKYYKAILFARGYNWDFHVYGNKWFWWDYNYHQLLFDLPLPVIPIENAATVLGILYWLPFSISKKAICSGLQFATLPGRLQIITHKPLVILDVGHNPHAANYLVKRLSTMISIKDNMTVRVVIGMLKSKDIRGTVRCLSNLVNFWYCAALDTPLTALPTQLSADLVNSNNIQHFNNILDAWDQARSDAMSDDCILVFGSFHAVSPIMKKISNSF